MIFRRAPSLRPPFGCSHVKIRPDGGEVAVEWVDEICGLVCEADLTVAEIAEWERVDGPPADLWDRARCEWLHDSIVRLRAEIEAIRARMDGLKADHLGIHFGDEDDIGDVVEQWLTEGGEK